jgi:two-component system response regulator TtrR
MVGESSLFIVDRNTSSRHALSRLVRAAGYHVQSFEFIENFFELDIKGGGACLLLDIDKLEISIKKIKVILDEDYTNLLVFVISSDDNKKARNKAHLIGAKEYFRKPVDGKALIDSINWAIRTRGQD